MTAPAVDTSAPCAACPPGCPRSDHKTVFDGRGWTAGRCNIHRRCQRFELDELAAVEPLLQVRAEDYEPLLDLQETADASPTDPPAEQHDEPAPPADSPADPTTEPVGQLLAVVSRGRTWWCLACQTSNLRAGYCCGAPRVPALVTVEVVDPITAEVYAKWFPERGDDGQPRKDDDDG